MKLHQNKKCSILSYSLLFLIVFLGGLILAVMETIYFIGFDENEICSPSLVFFLIIFFPSVFLHIILHELGHLVFGKLTGYRFISFRIGSLMLQKSNGQFQLKKYYIKGTAGQCIMAPGKFPDAHAPYLLFNLGGGIFNILFSISGLLIAYLFVFDYYLYFSLVYFAFAGVILGFFNLIPMNTSGITNDGANAAAIHRDPVARYAFLMQLSVQAKLTDGFRLRDIPTEWFDMPSNADLNNPLICSILVNQCFFLYDNHKFDRAKALTTDLLHNAPGLLGLHRNELLCELLFNEIMGSCNRVEINRYYTKPLKNYIKAMSGHLSKLRLQYAYELMVEHNEYAAQKQLDKFQKLKKSWPFSGEIESEIELIKLIQNTHSMRKKAT